jgi:hypothetical protein
MESRACSHRYRRVLVVVLLLRVFANDHHLFDIPQTTKEKQLYTTGYYEMNVLLLLFSVETGGGRVAGAGELVRGRFLEHEFLHAKEGFARDFAVVVAHQFQHFVLRATRGRQRLAHRVQTGELPEVVARYRQRLAPRVAAAQQLQQLIDHPEIMRLAFQNVLHPELLAVNEAPLQRPARHLPLKPEQFRTVPKIVVLIRISTLQETYIADLSHPSREPTTIGKKIRYI